jgi:hypothetical protein
LSNESDDIVILTGHGRYADPWHPFATTSDIVRRWLHAAGLSSPVVVVDDVDEQLRRWGGGSPLPRLVVANLGLPRDGGQVPADRVALRGLERLRDGAVPVLALHVAATTFIDAPVWRELLGGRWIRGTSWHPPQDAFTVRALPTHAAAALGDGRTTDERYARLARDPDVTVIAAHEVDGEPEPTAWLLERSARRAAYVSLGHDEAAYGDVMEILFVACVNWLLQSSSELSA